MKPYGHRHSPETVGQEPVVVVVVERMAEWSAMTSPSPCNQFPAWVTVQGCPWEPQDYNWNRWRSLGEQARAPPTPSQALQCQKQQNETQTTTNHYDHKEEDSTDFPEELKTILLSLFLFLMFFHPFPLLIKDDKSHCTAIRGNNPI